MKKKIHRDLVFTAADVRCALDHYLSHLGQQFPQESATNVVFSLSKDGARLAWTEEMEA